MIRTITSTLSVLALVASTATATAGAAATENGDAEKGYKNGFNTNGAPPGLGISARNGRADNGGGNGGERGDGGGCYCRDAGDTDAEDRTNYEGERDPN